MDRCHELIDSCVITLRVLCTLLVRCLSPCSKNITSLRHVCNLQNRVENLADVSTRCSGLLQGEEGQSIWSKRRHGFQPCFEAGIRELPFLMPEPAEKSSLHVCNQCKNLYINSRHAHLVTHAYVHCHLNDCLCKQQVGSLLNNITKTCMQSMHEPIPI